MVPLAAAGNAVINYRKTSVNEALGGVGQHELKIRKEFPESWIFEDLDNLGLVTFRNHFSVFCVAHIFQFQSQFYFLLFEY